MKKILLCGLSLIISYFGMANFCHADTTYIYVAADNGILKCNSDFKNCISPFNSVAQNTGWSYISYLDNNQIIYNIKNVNSIFCFIKENGNIDSKYCYPTSFYSSQIYVLGNIVYNGAWSFYLNYSESHGINLIRSDYDGIPFNFTKIIPLHQIDNSQLTYAFFNNQIYLTTFNVLPSSFNNINANSNYPFTGTTPFYESSILVNIGGVQWSGILGAVISQNNKYVYVLTNFELITCNISNDYQSFYNCNYKPLKNNPVNIYLDKFNNLYLIYNNYINKYALNSEGQPSDYKTVYRNSYITSMGFYTESN